MQIAHLSDVHVRWEPGAGGPWYGFAGKRLIGWLNMVLHRNHAPEIFEAAIRDLAQDPPDHLALTGDLSNVALDSEFERAAEMLAKSGLSPDRISLIPGNHDTYTRGSYRDRRFERLFGAVLGDDVVWPRSQRHGDVLFVSTTSCVPTPWFTAYGRMGVEQLSAVREQLRADAGFKVLLVHHPPVQADGRPDHVWRRNLDGADLLSVCREGGVGLVLCGHTHKAFDFTVEGKPPVRVYCAGSTTKWPARLGASATYNRYTVEEGRLVSVEVRGYDPDREVFTSLGSQKV